MTFHRRPRFVTVILSRVGSSRLPRKALAKIRGKTVLEHIIDRALSAREPDEVILVTTTKSEDDALMRIAKRCGIGVSRGSAKDKLMSVYRAAVKYDADYVVEFDGDDLFCSPELIDAAVKEVRTKPCDVLYATRRLICGSFTMLMSTHALRTACALKASTDTEMMKGYLVDSGLFKVRHMHAPALYFNKNIRITLDYPEDFAFFHAVYDAMEMRKNTVPLRDIIRFLQRHPALPKINWFRQHEFVGNQVRRTTPKFKKH